MQTTTISGLWLRTYGNEVQVLVERNGKWHMVIAEYADIRESTISYIVGSAGIEQIIADAMTDEE